MDEDGKITLSGQEAATAQNALRQALGLPPEQFPLPAFIGMVSDEIEQLRARGDNDEQIAQLLTTITRRPITAALVQQHYASPEERGHHGGH